MRQQEHTFVTFEAKYQKPTGIHIIYQYQSHLHSKAMPAYYKNIGLCHLNSQIAQHQSIGCQIKVDPFFIPQFISQGDRPSKQMRLYYHINKEFSRLEALITRVFAWPKLEGAKETSIPPTCSQKSLSPKRCLHLFPNIICIITSLHPNKF